MQVKLRKQTVIFHQNVSHYVVDLSTLQGTLTADIPRLSWAVGPPLQFKIRVVMLLGVQLCILCTLEATYIVISQFKIIERPKTKIAKMHGY